MNQKGFTLIELVVVIVVLGILAAVAVPKFVDLSEEAETAAVKGVAGALGSASAINYAAFKTDSTASTKALDVTSCVLQSNLLESWDGTKYQIVNGSTALASANPIEDCIVETLGTPMYSASFTAFYVSTP